MASLESFEVAYCQSGWYSDQVVPPEITHPFRPPGLLDQLVETMLETSYDMVHGE